MFIEEIKQYSVEKLVYVDESGIDTFISRQYGWGLRGQKVLGEVSGKRYARERFVAALVNKKIIAPMCYQGTCDTNLFNFWLANFLLPILGPGYTIIILKKAVGQKFTVLNYVMKSIIFCNRKSCKS